jgi:hypothetical protein
VWSATMNVQADCGGKSTKNVVPVRLELLILNEIATLKLNGGAGLCPVRSKPPTEQILSRFNRF